MIWRHLGFSQDIFFVDPLKPIAEDIELFVGREDLIKKYIIDTLSSSRSLKIVTGDIGVGKTTFVNACQYYSYIGKNPISESFEMPKLLPCYEKIQVRETDTINEFYQQVLTSIAQSITIHCRSNDIEAPKEVRDLLSFFLDLYIPVGGGGISGGLTIGGFGGQLSKMDESRKTNLLRNARVHLQNLIELAINVIKLNGVFVIVNNLDILSRKKVIELFNETRDELLNIQGIFWTFIGSKGLGSVIECEVKRVADYMSGTEIEVPPMSYQEIQDMISARVRKYRIRESNRCPLEKETLSAIFKLSMREARETLRICGEIVKRVILINPSLQIIPHENALSAFFQYAYDTACNLELTEQNVRVLSAVYEQKHCRPRDYELFKYKSSQAFISALRGLVNKKLLTIEVRGRARIYRPTGMTVVAAVSGNLGKEIQSMALKSITADLAGTEQSDNDLQNAQLHLDIDDYDEENGSL